MRSEKKNRTTILLGVLIVVVIIGICFTCVTLYARHEINKPKFRLPESTEPPLTEVLTDKDAAFEYAMRKYTSTVEADNTEGTWKTEARRLDEDWTTPFSKADEAIINNIREKAGEQLKEMYPQAEHVRLAGRKDVPQFIKQAQDVLDFTVTLGRENDKKEIVDTDRYFLTLTFDPESEDTQAILDSESFQKIAAELSPIAVLSDTQIEMQSITMCFAIDCVSEELVSVETKRDMLIRSTVTLTDDSAALLDTNAGQIELPYSTTQTIDFLHYGAHFTSQAIAVKPGDIKTLPAAINVNENATKDDYTLTFTSSEPDILSFDEDGMMTVAKGTHDDPVTVTMTLAYEGQTYTDQLTVYITRLEVDADV